MPQIRSDDGPRSLRNVWLGLKDVVTWPVEWSYSRWFATIGCAALVGFALFLLLSLAGSVQAGLFSWFTFGNAAGVWAGKRLAGDATPDEPLTYRIQTLIDQRRLRTPSRRERYTITPPPITTLSLGAARALRR